MGTRKSLVARLRLIFPIIGQLEAYRSGWLVDDIADGLAIAAIALPVAVAYPAIAGLPAETGLCASILALIGYALFGPSRQLIVGPDVATYRGWCLDGTAGDSGGPRPGGFGGKFCRPGRRSLRSIGSAAPRVYCQLPLSTGPDRLSLRDLAVASCQSNQPFHYGRHSESRFASAALGTRRQSGFNSYSNIDLWYGDLLFAARIEEIRAGDSRRTGRIGDRYSSLLRI